VVPTCLPLSFLEQSFFVGGRTTVLLPSIFNLKIVPHFERSCTVYMHPFGAALQNRHQVNQLPAPSGNGDILILKHYPTICLFKV
jgi:hypothetical protein